VSPDGRFVAVAAAGQGSPDYHVTLVDLTGPSSRRVSDEPASDVSWSPGSDRIAATVGDRIVIIDPSGQSPSRTLTQIRGRDLGWPAWSPDGQQIAVAATVRKPYRD
jgi:Tol biopolymer transport system component